MKSKILTSLSHGLFGLGLAGLGQAVNADDKDTAVQPLPAPSDQQIERALQLGNQFQGMAYRQNQPLTGEPFPISYVYRPEFYTPYYLTWPHSPIHYNGYYLRFSPHLAPAYPRLRPFHFRSPMLNRLPAYHHHHD